MAAERKKIEEEPAGAPDWMITFSDCMTLLLTFFVLLLSFASFHKETLPSLGQTLAKSLPSVMLSQRIEADSIHKHQQVKYTEKTTKGSETPTLAQQRKKNVMREKISLDFRNLKVFTLPSNQLFLGKGSVISIPGREVLNALAKFIRSAPSRIVISENGPGEEDLGFERAWAIMEYMTKEAGFKKEAINITYSTTVKDNPMNERMVEITLLERNILE